MGPGPRGLALLALLSGGFGLPGGLLVGDGGTGRTGRTTSPETA